MKVEIDGKSVTTVEQFHTEVSQKLGFPSHYGRNLDALWDVLTGSLERPAHLTWRNSEVSRRELGHDFGRIVGILERVARQDIEYGWTDRFEFELC